MPVTTRIIPFSVGNPYKPSFATVTGWGVDPSNKVFEIPPAIFVPVKVAPLHNCFYLKCLLDGMVLCRKFLPSSVASRVALTMNHGFTF